MKDKIDRMLSDELHRNASAASISKLHGDASYRTYYRVHLSDGSSLIVMQMPAGKCSASEEITNYDGSSRELPFVNVDRYLSSLGIAVPQIYHYSDTDRIMLLEDLGDELLSNAIENADIRTASRWYERTIDLLAEIQRKTSKYPSDECIAFKRSFDSRLLNWEFDHFLEYGFKARGIKLSDRDLRTFRDETRAITSEIEKMKYCFTLRDFQSRNIIIRDDEMFIIDFQDALMGPRVYDLVSLTRDSYIGIGDDMLFPLIDRYASALDEDTAKIREEFDLVTVQRKLKDAGRFVYIDRVKKNSSYLKFIPTSLKYVRAALERLPEHSPLLDTLVKYSPELG